VTQFRLEKKSATRALVKFHVMAGDAIVGSISVAPSQEADLLRHWKGPTPAAKPTGSMAAMAATLLKGPRLSKAALLRGC
jgi:hypothetical protein